MTLPVIAVVLPTVDGREEHYLRCRAAYEDLAAGSYHLQLIVEKNHPTVGRAWNAGAEKMHASAEWVHLTADDIEPMPGWHEAAIDGIRRGILPAPRVINGYTGAPEFFPSWGQDWPEGTFAGLQALPFVSREMWDGVVKPMFLGHYYTDNWVTYRAAVAGYEARVTRGYHVKHYWASVRRGAGMSYAQRLEHDRGLFFQAVAMAEQGRWTQPWPALESETARANPEGSSQAD